MPRLSRQCNGPARQCKRQRQISGFMGLVSAYLSLYIHAMQKDSKLFEDIAKLASGAAGAAMDMRRELEAMVGDKIERLVARGRFVSREEFDVVKDMATKAREENASLRAELEMLKRK